MAEWEHKEEEWYEYEEYFESPAYNGWVIRDGTLKSVECPEEDEDVYDFTGWLNYHCDGGWEVLKISRNFQSPVSQT